jgi:Ulp1 protease family, C-terminal catalytic domain
MIRRTRQYKNISSPSIFMRTTSPLQNTRTMNCSPIVKGKTVSENTCFTNDALTKIKDAFNKNNGPDNQIVETDPAQVYEALRSRLTQCKTEDCWLNQIKDSKTRQQLDQILFAPDQPPEWKDNPDEWLSNFDIEKVLQQYEISNPEFKLLGPSSIDYDTKLKEEGGKCVWEDICRLELKDLIARKKRKLGIVFNLDKHDEPGSHWVSMFVDLDKKFIFYFDSALNDTPPEIVRLKKTIMKQGSELSPPIQFRYITNKKAHQQSNTECGMYTIYFIVSLLTGKQPINKKSVPTSTSGGENSGENGGENGMSLEVFEKGKISDKEMMDFRKVFFNQNNPNLNT